MQLDLRRTSPRIARIALAASVAAAGTLPQLARADLLYWDINGTTANTGTTATGEWDGVALNWNDASTGTGGTPRAITTASDDLFFSSGDGLTGASTITVTGTQLGNSLTIEEGSYTFNGGTISLTGGITVASTASTTATVINGAVTVAAAQNWNVATGRQLTLNGVVAIDNRITLNGGNIVRFNSMAANTGAGGVTLNSGTMIVNNVAGIGTGSLIINGGSINTANSTLANNNVQTWNGNWQFIGTGALNMGTGAISLANNIQLTVTANTLTLGGAIDGANSLTKVGAGVLVLSGASTFTGGLAIRQGDVIANISNTTTVSGAAGPSTSAITLGGGTDLSARLLANTFTVSNPINLAASGTGTRTISNNANAAAVFSGAIALGGNDLIVSSGGTGSTTISGGVSGTGNLLITGSSTSTRTLSTTSLNHVGAITHSPTGTGATTISAAIGSNVTEVVQSSSTSTLILTNLTNSIAALTIKSGILEGQRAAAGTPLGTNAITLGDSSGSANASLQFQGTAATFANPVVLGASTGLLSIRTRNGSTAVTFTGGVTGANNVRFDNGINNNSQPFNITTNAINNAGTVTHATSGSGVGGVAISAVIGTNVTGVIQDSNARLVLTGANTYTGPTTVNLGLLLANTASPNSATGTGAVTVNAAGTLGGTGRIGGAVNITADGTLSPGAPLAVGTLTIGAAGTALSFADGGVLKFETSGSSGDLINLTGTASTVAFGSSWDLDITALTGDPTGGTFTLIDYTSTTDPALPSTINFVGAYTGIVSIDTVNHAIIISNVTLVPEPAGLAVAGLAAMGLLTRRRRRGRTSAV